MHTGEEYVRHALRAGASGYLLKDAATTELALAIEALRHNRSYLSSAISKDVIDRHRRQSQDPKSRPVKPLTPRMREILQLIAEGDSTKEIAHRLSLSVKTIETHRMHLMARLNIHDVAGLVRYALRNGLISAEK
jgi:DNA-binding NarL/FixJ family response regulator